MIHTRCVISRYRHVQCLSVGNRCRLQSRSSNILLYEMEDSSDTMVENEFKLCNSEVKNESDDFPKKNEKQLKLLKVMATDDSMSDDVFETEDTLKTPAARPQPQPSPTGYRGYKPPVELFQEQDHDQEPPHKTILLGDSGVGKTSLLVRFDTGQFQTGTFSATVGIGFTIKEKKKNIHQVQVVR